MLSKHRKLSGPPLSPGFYETSLSPGAAVAYICDASLNGSPPKQTAGPPSQLSQRVHNNEGSTPWSTAEQQAFILANYLWYMEFNKIALLVGSKSVGGPWAHLGRCCNPRLLHRKPGFTWILCVGARLRSAKSILRAAGVTRPNTLAVRRQLQLASKGSCC